MEKIEYMKMTEAIMFAVGRPVTIEEFVAALDVEKEMILEIMEDIAKKYSEENAGIVLVKVKNGYQLVTNKSCYKQVAAFVGNSKKENLPPAAMEVLSIIAYNPKITKSEIEKIRGTNSDSQVSRLLEYGLVEETGRLKVAGRPAVFEVTTEFLRSMGINSVEELPDYEKLKNKDIDLDAFREEEEE